MGKTKKLASVAPATTETTEKTIEAWHSCDMNENGQPILAYDLEGTVVEVGKVYELPDGIVPELCERGFHGSVRALDMLRYYSGPIICRVKLSGRMDVGDDKIAAQRREVLWFADMADALKAFAFDAADLANREFAPAALDSAAEALDGAGLFDHSAKLHEHAAKLRALPQIVDEESASYAASYASDAARAASYASYAARAA